MHEPLKRRIASARLSPRRWIAFSLCIFGATTQSYAQMPMQAPSFEQEPYYTDVLLNRARFRVPAFLEDLETRFEQAQQQPDFPPDELAHLTFLYAALLQNNWRLGTGAAPELQPGFHLRLAGKRVREQFGKHSMPMAYVHLLRGQYTGRYVEAKRHYRRAIHAAKMSAGEHALGHLRVQWMAGAIVQQNYRVEPRQYLTTALNGLTEYFPANRLELASIRYRLGLLLLQKEPDEGVPLLQAATEDYAASGHGWMPENLYAHMLLAQHYERTGSLDDSQFHIGQLSKHPPPEANAPPMLIWRARAPRRPRPLLHSETAALRFSVSAQGRVTDIRLIDDSNTAKISEHAISRLQRFYYRPAFRDGIAVATEDMVMDFDYQSALPLPDFLNPD